jgi:hypothetical protein
VSLLEEAMMMRRLLDLTEQEPSDLEGGRKGGQTLLPLLPKPTPSSPPHQTRTTAAGDLVAAGVVGVASAVTVSLEDHVHHPLHHHHLYLHNPFQRELVEGIYTNICIYIYRERDVPAEDSISAISRDAAMRSD